jgi:hypothetical protein
MRLSLSSKPITPKCPLKGFAQDAALPTLKQNSAPHAAHPSNNKASPKPPCLYHLHRHRPKHRFVHPVDAQSDTSNSINAGTAIKRKDIFRELAVIKPLK